MPSKILPISWFFTDVFPHKKHSKVEEQYVVLSTTVQNCTAWTMHKDDMQTYEAFHIFTNRQCANNIGHP